ncbi:hypothetical protein SKAU_G00081530 [Synaphobranchus kaupii]|uniref:Uncharacterized protein n=1 Tax=Synaphobranchus kaupii TaxID=118154 RepID=A0A9Q1FVS3_SYNKA|nr:hypothetical protein SKAU_G00081530 [Synaphobranchus kaupii]
MNSKMQLFLKFFLLAKLASSLQKDAVIQYVYTEVVGRADTPVATRTLNGAPVPWNYSGHDIQRDNINNSVHDPFFETSLKIILESFNHTSAKKQEVMLVLVPALAVLSMMVLLLISFLLFKRQVSSGNGHPGGTMGSIIHYPPNLSQVTHGYEAI